MSERINWKINTPYVFQFIMSTIGGTMVTGAVNGDFVKRLTLNSALSGVTVTVSEIDPINLPGWYKAVYAPDTIGYWRISITHSTYNPFGWESDINVYVNNETDDRASGIDLVKAMSTLDTSTSPWSLCLIKYGTGTPGANFLDGTILRRVYLYRASGLGITTATSVIGSQYDN